MSSVVDRHADALLAWPGSRARLLAARVAVLAEHQRLHADLHAVGRPRRRAVLGPVRRTLLVVDGRDRAAVAFDEIDLRDDAVRSLDRVHRPRGDRGVLVRAAGADPRGRPRARGRERPRWCRHCGRRRLRPTRSRTGAGSRRIRSPSAPASSPADRQRRIVRQRRLRGPWRDRAGAGGSTGARRLDRGIGSVHDDGRRVEGRVRAAERRDDAVATALGRPEVDEEDLVALVVDDVAQGVPATDQVDLGELALEDRRAGSGPRSRASSWRPGRGGCRR